MVECGSGRSTVVIARSLRELGGGSVHSLEHDPAWAQLTRMRLAAEGLAAIATVIEAPLSAHPLAQPGCRWYARWALRELPEGLDLLLVDGPPAGEAPIERSRYPALPALAGPVRPGRDRDPRRRRARGRTLGARAAGRPSTGSGSSAGPRTGSRSVYVAAETRGAERRKGSAPKMRGTRLWLLIAIVALLASAFVAAGCGDDERR